MARHNHGHMSRKFICLARAELRPAQDTALDYLDIAEAFARAAETQLSFYGSEATDPKRVRELSNAHLAAVAVLPTADDLALVS